MSKIEFIIPTYSRVSHLLTILGSLKAQTNQNWKAHVVADCPPYSIKEYMKKMIEFLDDERIVLTFTENRYNDWGHTPRNIGLENATEDWVIMTGEDNYYVPTFVENFLNAISESTHFVFCNMVHNWNRDQYVSVDCQPSYGKIDMGNFMTKTEFAKQMKLDVTLISADAKFVDEYLKNFKGEVVKIDKFLYVHN